MKDAKNYSIKKGRKSMNNRDLNGIKKIPKEELFSMNAIYCE
jgi:hypothetical protein